MRWLRRNNETTEHEYAQDRLSAYLDEELAPAERSRVESHLDGCPQCRCDLDNLRRTVQWTMALPVVPCPRSFAVPVAAPKRAQHAQRVWGMPLLQGATAVVAVLFLLAVVGEAFLPGIRPMTAPAPAAVERESAAQVGATQVAELQPEQVTLMAVEAPAEASPVPEAAALEETVVVESVQDQAAAAASAAPPGMGIGAIEAEQPPSAAATDVSPKASVGVAGGAALPTSTPWPTPTVEPSLTPVPSATPEPTLAPSPTATLVPTVALAPTLVAAAGEERALAPAAQAEETSDGEQQANLGWLTTVEIVLGVAFVLLGTITALLMARRLRRG